MVGLVAVAGLVATVPTLLAVADALPAGAGTFAAISFVFGSLSNLIGPFVSWLMVGAALFLGSLVVGGDGELRDLFALVGWGFAPRVVAPVVGGIVSFVILRSPALRTFIPRADSHQRTVPALRRVRVR